MLRRHGLDHGAAAIRAAAGAADDLRDEGERGLRRAEVVDVEAHIRVQHADERDGRKIEALGDHLRAEQDRDLLVAEAAQHRLVAAGGGDGIRIHAQNCRIRERARARSSRSSGTSGGGPRNGTSGGRCSAGTAARRRSPCRRGIGCCRGG